MYYVYILLLNNGNLYKGFSKNVGLRVEAHKSGRVVSTKGKLPVKLIHIECYLLEFDARRRERFLKTTEGRRLLSQQIRDVLQHTQ